ncbi:MAG: hypothetical protein K0A90_07985 [Methanosarcinaceae archaeon]|nr:hypothetical protein [Methanosarcinaceae archaeon]
MIRVLDGTDFADVPSIVDVFIACYFNSFIEMIDHSALSLLHSGRKRQGVLRFERAR